METELEQEQLYEQFAQERSEVERLAKRIETKCGCPVEVRHFPKSGRWGFYAPKNFAFARKIKSRIRIATKEEWAARAGIDRSRYCVRPNAFFPGKPAAYVCIEQDNAESLEEVASILAKVCEARHR